MPGGLQLRGFIRRVDGGKIASEHLYFDQIELLQQLGAMPAPGT
jgi:hypothetical protein